MRFTLKKLTEHPRSRLSEIERDWRQKLRQSLKKKETETVTQEDDCLKLKDTAGVGASFRDGRAVQPRCAEVSGEKVSSG